MSRTSRRLRYLRRQFKRGKLKRHGRPVRRGSDVIRMAITQR